MPVIHLFTHVNAPPDRCFDLSRSIDLHTHSTEGTHEQAVAGVTSGLIGLGEKVTWRAKHLGFYQHLTSVISEYQYPYSFTDEQVKGIFESIHHRHVFTVEDEGTLMEDIFDYKAPLGLLGKLADVLFLKSYMKGFLLRRNAFIKQMAEGEAWKNYLTNKAG